MSDQLSLLAPEVMIGLTRPSYHQRRPIPGQAPSAAAEIASGERKAREQESAVLAFYKSNPGGWSPSQVWMRVGPKNDAWSIERDAEGLPERVYIAPRAGSPRWPITSIRARITTLEKKKFLKITMDRIMGPFGRMEHIWKLATE